MGDFSAPINHLILFAQSIAMGFLIGLERERRNENIAGLRTFTLIAMLGSIAGYIFTKTDMAYFALGISLLGLLSLFIEQQKVNHEEPNSTTLVSAVITFFLGFMVWLGHALLPAALAIITTAVLYFKTELRSLTHRLTREDVSSFLQFAAVAIILLPVLPDQTFGPYQVVNPYQVGWLVVLISGLSLLGYVILRFISGHNGIVILGLLGGLVSTTATTMVYAKQSKRRPELSNVAGLVILLSHLVLFVRIFIVTGVVEPMLIKPMIPWLIGGLLFGCLYVGFSFLKLDKAILKLPDLKLKNPAELSSAFGFAISFALVLLIVAWVNDTFSQSGVYFVSFVSGATDVDAITISNLKLAGEERLSVDIAINAIITAFFANLVFKFGVVSVSGDTHLKRHVLKSFLVISMGVVLGWAVKSTELINVFGFLNESL
ncbi:MAG: MgtC/SapB family protein [Pseudomonadales bacterium]|nr:MgtC/SapB family protein [Pseudomonadales bacterium]